MSRDIRRYLVILDLLEKAEGNVTREEIKAEQKKEGLGFSTSTLSRDYQFLVDLGFKIHLDNSKGYTLDIENTDEFSFLMNLFKRIALSNLLDKSITLEKETHKYLSLDDTSLVKNFQYFYTILEAIKNRKEISFAHTSFYHTDRKLPKSHIIKPHLLKEYQNRWYVIGETEDDFRVYGLDRITNLEVLDNKLFKNKTEEANELLSYTVGLNFNEHTPTEIILQFHSSQKPYLESLKLHKSQKEIETRDGFYTVKLFVSYNFELKQQLLKYGSLVQVLDPKFIRQDIQNELKKALEAYY